MPYLDVSAAARLIAQLADDDSMRLAIGAATLSLARRTFDMTRYVRQLDELGLDAVRIMRQRTEDFATLRDDLLFDEHVYLMAWPTATRQEAISGFLARWTAVGTSRQPRLRRPCAGFHPQIYAHENPDCCDWSVVNPLAHFIRAGKPDGPWCSELITPNPNPQPVSKTELRVGLHGHFFYPELALDLIKKLAANSSDCDLILTTESDAKAIQLQKARRRIHGR